MPAVVERDTRIKIEDAHPIHIGPAAVEALRADVHSQAHEALQSAHALWENTDVESLEELSLVRDALGAATVAIVSLVYLAPVPDEDA